jgi:kinesin family protein 11
MSGMLSEVLEGYNVTVFAYGQTGTGKTFTMLGDTPSSSNAGIIPRSLISLFESLEKDIAEYSVRVSVFTIISI